jgi:hypothetical protein
MSYERTDWAKREGEEREREKRELSIGYRKKNCISEIEFKICRSAIIAVFSECCA